MNKIIEFKSYDSNGKLVDQFDTGVTSYNMSIDELIDKIHITYPKVTKIEVSVTFVSTAGN